MTRSGTASPTSAAISDIEREPLATAQRRQPAPPQCDQQGSGECSEQQRQQAHRGQAGEGEKGPERQAPRRGPGRRGEAGEPQQRTPWLAPCCPGEDRHRSRPPGGHGGEKGSHPATPGEDVGEPHHQHGKRQPRHQDRGEGGQRGPVRPCRDRIGDPRPEDRGQRQDDGEGDQEERRLGVLAVLSECPAGRDRHRFDDEQDRGHHGREGGEPERHGQSQRRAEVGAGKQGGDLSGGRSRFVPH